MTIKQRRFQVIALPMLRKRKTTAMPLVSLSYRETLASDACMLQNGVVYFTVNRTCMSASDVAQSHSIDNGVTW